jgi:hypothetical protein
VPVIALPLVVRCALWGTRWLGGQGDVDDLVRTVHAGAVTDVAGPFSETLRGWAEQGETAVFLALPRPGLLTGMPRAHPATTAAATHAGQAAYAPTVGGALIPTLTRFGPEGDTGVLATWAAYETEPVPRHVAEALDAGDLSRRLSEAVQEATTRLAMLGGIPWRAGETTPPPRASVPGLPAGMAPRSLHLLDRAADVRAVAMAGIRVEEDGAALDATTSVERVAVLRRLLIEAEAALVGATNVLAMSLAGWRPA